MEQLREWLRLSMVDGLGLIGLWALVEHFGSPQEALAATPAEWRTGAGLKAPQVEALAAAACLRPAVDAELQRMAALGGRILCFADDDYPALLRTMSNPPPVLYVRGTTEALKQPAVALIGSRSATSYGRRTAHRLARDLAERGITVVSGMAAGVDGEAHAGSLDGNGYTIGVLGCGLDVVYPRTHAALYRRVAASGLLISEYPLGTKPEPFRFPARNRIIAGLSRSVIVVEATRKSGTMITVQHALDAGRDVCAVPGQVDSAKSTGSHWLLQQGAQLVVCADDIVALLGLDLGVTVRQKPIAAPITKDRESLLVLGRIEPYPMLRDELLRLSGLSAPRLNEILLLLELEGAIELLPGDRLRRLG